MSSYSGSHKHEAGVISGLLIAVIALCVLVLGLGSFAIWSFVALGEAQTDVDGKIAVQVAKAREDKGNEDEAKFLDREKQPNLTFKGPDNYCGLRFNYPKTWSVYE